MENIDPNPLMPWVLIEGGLLWSKRHLKETQCGLPDEKRSPYKDLRSPPFPSLSCPKHSIFPPSLDRSFEFMLSNDSTQKQVAAELRGILGDRNKMGKILALDLGEAQIGLAISDDHKLLARGLETMKGRDRRNCMIVLGEIIRQQEVDEIVVGLPRNMNGSLGRQAEKALAFVQELERQFGLPVKAWDERLTTVAAKRTLIESGVKRSRRGRDSLDRISAILILQSYLDSLSRRAGADPIQQG